MVFFLSESLSNVKDKFSPKKKKKMLRQFILLFVQG
jgi:hypothetical protein